MSKPLDATRSVLKVLDRAPSLIDGIESGFLYNTHSVLWDEGRKMFVNLFYNSFLGSASRTMDSARASSSLSFAAGIMSAWTEGERGKRERGKREGNERGEDR